MSDRTHTITFTLTVSDEDGDGVWVVTDDLGTMFGGADSAYGAVHDYLTSMGFWMRHLQHSQEPLGPALQQEYDALRAWVEGRKP